MSTARAVHRVAMVAVLMSAACAPVMETPIRKVPERVCSAVPAAGVPLVITTSSFAATEDSLDPAIVVPLVRRAADRSGLPCRILISDGKDASERPVLARLDVERLEYSIRALREPPPPPLGIGILYPFVLHRMMTRDFLQLKVAVQANLSIAGPDGMVSRTTVTEEVSARANMFKSGEAEALEKLKEAVSNNLFGRALQELMHLTNAAGDDNKSP